MKINLIREFSSMRQLSVYFKNEKQCREFLAFQRWKGTPKCPYCGHDHIYHKCDGRYACAGCGNTFSVLVGTVFQNTKLPLIVWFKAIYLVSNSKQGISSCQLSMILGVTQKTAWFILHKIRILMKQRDDEFEDVVQGNIELRESNKGTLFWVRIPFKIHNIHPKVLKYVQPGSRIFTDYNLCAQSLFDSEYEIYKIEDPYPLYAHTRSFQSENIVDGFWLQLKRLVMGVCHFVSAAHFHRYIYEVLFRKQHARLPNSKRFYKLMNRIEQAIPYKVVRPR